MHVRERAVVSLLDVCAITTQLLEILSHVSQPVKVRREKRPAAIDVVEMMQACIADSDAILGSGAPANFVHNDLHKIPC